MFVLAALSTAAPWPAWAAKGGGKTATDRDKQSLLQADEISYDKDNDLVIATGRVEIQRQGQVLLADKVVYDRNADIATATGHVSLIEPNGTVIYVESVQVTGDMKQALAGEVRALMADKSRMTGRNFRRTSDRNDEIYESSYTACDVCKQKAPLWRIQADRVRRDVDAQMVYYHDMWLDLLGVPVFYTPYLASPDPSAGRKSGFLMPAIGGGSNLGGAYAQPYYINIAPDKDATITSLYSSAAGKGGMAEYREDFQHGRVTMFGSVVADDPATPGDVRGNFRGTGIWDMDDNWRSGADINLASDQTYLRRYEAILPGTHHTALPWLTSNVDIERFDTNSYFSANAYYFQRQLEVVAQPSPIVAPLLYYNYTSDPLSFGGFLKVDASGVVLSRIDGSDTDRLSTTVSYNLPFTTSQGFEFNARAAVRADGYYVTDFIRPSNGQSFTGTVGRTLPEVSLEWRWPLVRPAKSFTQVLEPIVMVYAAPIAHNPETIPDEDSSNFELDDTNIFRPDRLTGYDRVEGGERVAYGLKWSAYSNTHSGSVSAMIAQSYSFHRDPQFTPLSGLADKASDYVGHVDFSPNQYVSLQYRFRFDKDTFANRRTEVTGVFGPDLLRTVISYIDIPEDTIAAPGALAQKELFTAVFAKLSRYWALSASHRQNLGPGGGAIRSDFGVNYEDECFIFSLTVAKDNTSDRDFKSGVGVLLRFGFKTIGDLRLNTDVGSH